MIKATDKIWHNGTMIPWDEARVHVLTHALHYGTSVFEGIRCYATPEGPAIFRAKEHIRRLFDSCKIYRMDELAFTQDQLVAALSDLVKVNKLDACYLRPIAFRGYGEVGVLSLKNPMELYIACWEWGEYLGPEAIEKGVDVCVSSWSRLAPNTLPAIAKVAANYMNSQLIKMEAVLNGYAEGIALDTSGYVSEGSGENIFIVRDNKIYTPPLGNSVLPGITRDSVIQLGRDIGLEFVEQMIPRELLYIADEVFFTGTAAEITPIRSVDKIPVGTGERGPITQRLQEEFWSLLTLKSPDPYGWLTFVDAPQPVSV